MAKLADKQTELAWDDFKKHLIDCGFLKEPADVREPTFSNDVIKMRLAKMAFKQGFVTGASQATEKTTYNPEPARKTKKFDEGRSVRTKEVRKADNEFLEAILKRHREPMELSEIIKQMNRYGRKHWNNNNGSGFVKMAAKDGYEIKRVGYGVYAYDGEAGE